MENKTKRQKITGTVLMILAGFLLVIIALALAGWLFMDDLPEIHAPDLAGLFVFTYFFMRLYKYGKQLRGKNKKEEMVELTGTVEVQVDIGEMEFVRLNYTLLYANPFVFIFTLFAATAMIEVVGQELEQMRDNLYILIIGLVLLVIFPLVILVQSRKQYRMNSQIHDVVSYTFDEDHFELVGRSFAKEYDWANLMRIKTTKKWIILFTSGREGFFIPIRCLQTEKQKQFLAAIQSIAE